MKIFSGQLFYSLRGEKPPVTATTYAATLYGAAHFGDAKQVRSYICFVPREYNSGEKQHRGRISKAGNSRARSLLVEAV